MAFSVLSLIICFFFIRLSSLLIENAENNVYQSLLLQQITQVKETEATRNPRLMPHIQHFTSLSTVPVEYKDYVTRSSYGKFRLNNGQQFVFRQFTVSQQPEVLLIPLDEFHSNHHLYKYKSLFLYSVSFSVLILCILSSWYLSKWLSRPIERLIANIAEKPAIQNIEQSTERKIVSIYGTERKDEIGKLANELKSSYQDIQQFIQREQNFTRDVSHELRTPITLIKNILTLQKSNELTGEEQDILKQAASELEQTVEILLALARQKNLDFTSIKVLPAIEKTLLNLYHLHPSFDFDIRVNVCSSMFVTGNPLLFTLLCQNLINNGIYHGNGQTMSIYSSQQDITFENSISQDLDRPYYQGLGHGQYLVQRIVEEMGWRFKTEQSNDFYKVVISTI